jgi:nucleoid-associated protein YgaU
MHTKHFRALLLGLAIAAPALAAAVEVASDAPERYTVSRGDTLWDIAGRYLREPWRWREIWERNPQVRNPDLIYPGDVLVLEYVDGRPVVRRVGRGGTVRLRPQVRELPGDEAIPAIPIDAVGPFISESRVLAEDELEQAPHILSAGREHLIGASGEVVYARGLIGGVEGQRYGVYRRGGVYRSPETGEVLGYEAVFVADVVVEEAGEPATLYVTRVGREIQPLDRLIPLEEDLLREPFVPRPPEEALRGTIISVLEGVTQVGRYQTVVIDLGTADGLEPGHVLTVSQRGAVIPDPDPRARWLKEPELGPDAPVTTPLDIFSTKIGNALAPAFYGRPSVQLPDRTAGMLMVIRPFDRVSYALVMEATRPMHVEDVVETP